MLHEGVDRIEATSSSANDSLSLFEGREIDLWNDVHGINLPTTMLCLNIHGSQSCAAAISQMTFSVWLRLPYAMPPRSIAYSDAAFKLLIHLRAKNAILSECPLKLLGFPPDFDSTIRRFESSRPSQSSL